MTDAPFIPIVLSHVQTRVLLDAREAGDQSVPITPDLGLSEVTVSFNESGVALPGSVHLTWPDVEQITNEESKCFAVEPGGIRAIAVFSEETNWMRSLYPTEGAPTTLVGGFPMHRIKDTDPLADTLQKVRALKPVTGRVLDTATGLGYTAIEAARTADEVITVEIDPAAIEIARHNPWSRELFERANIQIIIGDIYEVIAEFDDASFDRIIHDPPTMSLAGELYSAVFYRQLRRTLAPRGRLFHYIGDPDSRATRTLTTGVIHRLQDAGFERVKRWPRAYGVMAYR